MQVSILTHEVRPLGNPSRKVITWESSSDRKWLMNHLHWAMHNSTVVHITPLRDSASRIEFGSN